MALQGTLETFALPDVLRLLASTKKTGCYRLDGNRGSGSLWVKDGQIIGGEVEGAVAPTPPAEVAFELLRFTDGDFVFDADAEPDTAADPVDVETILEQAESMLAEWKVIEAVVPSLDSWVSLRAELPSDEVTIRADRWISVVAIGGGVSIARLGSRLGLGELPVSRTVKELLELGLVEVGDAPAGVAAVPASGAGGESEPAVDTGSVPDPVDEPTLSLVDDVPLGDDGAIDDFVPFGADESDSPFEPFDPNGLVIEEPSVPGSSSADDLFTTSAPAPAPAPASSPSSYGEADPTDAAEIARQLANLSPKAAKAVAAAAKATTQEEREAALAEVDESEDPINRDLLLKFLGSVNS